MTAAPHTGQDLGRAVIDRLYGVLCDDGGDTFLTWRAPGPVLRPADFEFCTAGPDAVARPRLLRQARALAELVDVVPTGHTRLSTVYSEVLRRCRVVHGVLSDEERLKVGKYRDLLRTTRKVTDPATGVEREVTDDGPMLRAYQEKQAGYRLAVLRRALGGVDGVAAAMDDWIGCGYRHEVDQVTAYLDEIGRRDLRLWRRMLTELYEQGSVGGFHHTTLVPGDFATGDSWTEFTSDGARPPERPSWRSGADGVDFGLEGLDGMDGLTGFTLSCQLAEVIIARPWFHPGFLTGGGWTLDGEPLCDGGDPPSGDLIGYPTAALFVRNLRIDSAGFAAAVDRLAGRPSVGWGPFQLAGATVRARRVTVPGMQLVGFVNRRLGRTPNPLPQLDIERLS